MMPFDVHLEEIGRHPLGPGDGSFGALVHGHLALVVKIAKETHRPLGVELSDLVQAGYLGLIRAAQKYDSSIAQFSTYSTYWIKQSIRRYLASSPATPIYTPVSAVSAWGQLLRGCPIPKGKRKCAEAVDAVRRTYSLSGISREERQAFDLPDRSEQGPEALEENELRAKVAEAIKALPERDRLVLASRFSSNPKTLLEIGNSLGITKERVRQIEGEAISRIRQFLGLEQPRERIISEPAPIDPSLVTTAEAAGIVGRTPKSFRALARSLGVRPAFPYVPGDNRQLLWSREGIEELAAHKFDHFYHERRAAAEEGKRLVTTDEAAAACGIKRKRFLRDRPHWLNPVATKVCCMALWDAEEVHRYATSRKTRRGRPPRSTSDPHDSPAQSTAPGAHALSGGPHREH